MRSLKKMGGMAAGARTLLVIVVLWLLPSVSQAAEMSADTVKADTAVKKRELGRVRKTIRGLDRLNTNYIEPQHYNYTMMMQVTNTYENFILGSSNQSIWLAPDSRLKVGPYLGWRWFFFGYTFDLNGLGFDGGKLRKEFDLAIYSSQVGVDLFYRRTGRDYKIREAKLGAGIDVDDLIDQPFDGVRVGITGLNAYYIFSHGRFSYPAAFSQSTCQRVSCGSWMAGAGFTRNTLDMDFDKLRVVVEQHTRSEEKVKLDSGLMFSNIEYDDISLSGGYAYNWVFAKDWLFCASGQLALAYKKSHGDAEESGFNFDFENVNVDGIGRFGVVYNNTRWYTGFSAILRTNNYHTDRFSANNVFGSLNAYIGYNFGLKKKYRKK